MQAHMQVHEHHIPLVEGITVIVAARNEEEQLFNCVCNIIEGARLAHCDSYEIIIFDDGSTDGTTCIARKLAEQMPTVRSIRNETSQGLGAIFIRGIDEARYSKLTLFAGDNNAHASLAEALFQNRDMADVVISYFLNVEHRRRFRVFLSALFTDIYNTVFDLHLKYINGNSLYPVRLLRELDLRDTSYGISSEVLVKALRRGVSFFEVAGYANPDGTKSQSLTLRNLGKVILGFLRLLWTIHVAEREKYDHRPRRAHVPPFTIHTALPVGEVEGRNSMARPASSSPTPNHPAPTTGCYDQKTA